MQKEVDEEKGRKGRKGIKREEEDKGRKKEGRGVGRSRTVGLDKSGLLGVLEG